MDNRIEDLEIIKKVFEKYNVRFLIVYGALLGWQRDGNFIEHDDDIDIAVIDPIDLKTRKRIGWALYDLGFQTQQILFNVFGRMEAGEIGYNGDDKTGIIVCQRAFKFTIFFFGQPEECKDHGLEYVCVPKIGAMNLIATPAKFYQKLGEIKIGKQKYLTPFPIEDYLTFTYNNWKNRDDRDHGKTYFEMHPDKSGMLDIEGKNQVTILK